MDSDAMSCLILVFSCIPLKKKGMNKAMASIIAPV